LKDECKNTEMKISAEKDHTVGSTLSKIVIKLTTYGSG